MKLYVYPDATVSDEVQDHMSDDYFVVETEPSTHQPAWENVLFFHFGLYTSQYWEAYEQILAYDAEAVLDRWRVSQPPRLAPSSSDKH